MPILSDVFEHMPVPCLHIDLTGVITHINHKALLLFEKKVEDCVGQKPILLFSFDESRNDFEALNSIFVANKTGTYDFLSTGNQWMRLTATPIYTGIIITFAVINEDKPLPNLSADITTHETHRNSTEQLQLAVNGANIFTWVFNPETGETIYSSNFAIVLGFEVSAQHSLNIYPEDKSYVLNATLDAARDKASLDIEHRVVNPLTEELIWVRMQGQMVQKANGDYSFVGIIQNITAQKLAAEVLNNYNNKLEQEVTDRTHELHKNYALLQTIFDTTLIGMSIFEPVWDEEGNVTDFRILIVNKKIERSSKRNDMVGKLYGDLYPGIKKMGLYDAMVKTIETGEPIQMEYHYEYEGIDRWYSTMFVKGEETLVSTNLDITDRVQAEIQLRKMEVQRQQEIFQVILNTQEEERRRISESLHNGLGQLLYGIKLSLNYLTLKLSTSNPVKYVTARAYTDQLLAEAITETRNISHELMPTVLAEFGIEAAVREVCGQLQNKIKFNCTIKMANFKFDHYMELAVFRTVQELMVNVVKHSRASHAKVQIIALKSEIRIRVEDNGRGIPTNATEKQGIGLSSIRNKVDLLRGKLTINSEPGKGFAIEVTFPTEHFSK